MFDMLVASGSRTRRLGRAVPSSMMSLAIHGALVCGALAATTKATEIARAIVTASMPIYLPPPEPRRQPTPPALPVLERPTIGFRTVALVVEIPHGIPPVDLKAPWDLHDWTGKGREGGTAQGDPNGAGPVPVSIEQVFVVVAVDEPPVLLTGALLQYPPLLRDAGIEGEVVIEVVIGTDGRPEPETLRILRSTNRAFENAARAALIGCVFRPGRVRGQAVRVLIRQPIRFEIVGRQGAR